VLWIVLGAIGMVTIIVGGDVGFKMVFRMGVRVEAREGRRAGSTPGTAVVQGTGEAAVVPGSESTAPSEVPPPGS
jgi:hypothetical protein